MTGASAQLAKDFESALEAYLASGGEEALKRAYDLGRRAVNEGAGLIAVILLHQQALEALVEKSRPSARPASIRRAMQFLAECMAPFEMAHRGFQDAYARLRELNEEYHSVVAERTREFRNAEARFRAHIEQLPAVTYIESIKTRAPVYVSPQVEVALGFTPRQWLEDPGRWSKQIHPEDGDRILAEMAKFREGGPSFRAEYRLMAKSGREVWVRHEAIRVLDDAGRPQFTQGVLIDITDAKRAELAARDSETRFRSLFSGTSEALLIAAEADGRILDANAAAAALVGISAPDLGRKSLADLFPRGRPKPGSREGKESDLSLRGPGGESLALRVRAISTRVGETPAVLYILRPAAGA